MQGRASRTARDTALIRFLIDIGGRRAETTALDVEDVDLDGHIAWVIGKGGKRRFVAFGSRTRHGNRPLSACAGKARVGR
ncbi:MAG: tyrosine-type recombinase/integrase [Actinomycetota bacterium]